MWYCMFDNVRSRRRSSTDSKVLIVRRQSEGGRKSEALWRACEIQKRLSTPVRAYATVETEATNASQGEVRASVWYENSLESDVIISQWTLQRYATVKLQAQLSLVCAWQKTQASLVMGLVSRIAGVWTLGILRSIHTRA